MAVRTRQELVDDIDGSDAIDSFNFSFEGTDYEIELSEVHAKELSADMEKWIVHARRVGGRKKYTRAAGNGSAPKGSTMEVRTWAKENGWPNINMRGRIPAEVEQAYAARGGQ